MFSFSIKLAWLSRFIKFVSAHQTSFLILFLSVLSVANFVFYYQNGLGLAYNDSRSHLDIGRRVVEGLKPGLAQLGSVWLPLPHVLMIPTIWNDWMWHSGLSGALPSMIAFVATGVIIFRFLERMGVNLPGKLVAVLLFACNINVLYMQSTSMTELVLLATMTFGSYYLYVWSQEEKIIDLVQSAFWVMLSTLVRYDGWFLSGVCAAIIAIITFRKHRYQAAEGTTLAFITLAFFGILLWFGWNLAIYRDPLYFAFGPYSAYSQQKMIEQAGSLMTKGDLLLSIRVYISAVLHNTFAIPGILALIGGLKFYISRKYTFSQKMAFLSLVSPIGFNIIALFLGHSAMYIDGITGGGWFNVRYGMMLLPVIAILVGFLFDRQIITRPLVAGILIMVMAFSWVSQDNIILEDGINGKSYSDITAVADYLKSHAVGSNRLTLISTAKNDPVVFSSMLPMRQFVYEGTGLYWDFATQVPDRWVKWIVTKVGDRTDPVYQALVRTPGFAKYNLVASSRETDLYELKSEFDHQLPEADSVKLLKE